MRDGREIKVGEDKVREPPAESTKAAAKEPMKSKRIDNSQSEPGPRENNVQVQK